MENCETFFGRKIKKFFKMTLMEDNQIISQDKQIAKIFNEYFMSIPVLNMTTYQELKCSHSPEENTLLRKIGKY